MIQDLPVAAVGDQPRLHRPQPVVRALRRRGPARLPALRPRPGEGRGRAVRAGAWRRRCSCATALTGLGMPCLRQDHRLARHPRLRAHRARARRRRRSGRSPSAWPQSLAAAAPAAGHRRVPRGQAAAGPRAGRLQPERLGPHPGLGLLGAAAPQGGGLDAGDLGGDRARARASRTSTCATFPPRLAEMGDLWAPLAPSARKRFRLDKLL